MMKRFNLINNFSTDFSYRVLMSGMSAIALTGLVAMMAQPASAGDLLEDAAIGAGVGLGTGLILGESVGADDAINGAAAGAACHVANEALQEDGDRSLVQDLGVGAVAAGGVGTITNDDGFVSNAAQGAAACGVIHILD